MASWVLIPCLKLLFTEFDRLAPNRDKASDGSIGDTIHQETSSDHNPDETGKVPIHDADKVNEVHAIDVDNNLNSSEYDMEEVVQFLLGRCRLKLEKRLRYIIYNKRMWQAKNGWVQETYTGPSPHTEHAHFSASYDTYLESSLTPWLEYLMAFPTAKEIVDELLARKVHFPYGKPGDDTRTVGTQIGYIPSRDTIAGATAAAVKSALAPQFDAALTVSDMDEIVSRVLAGLAMPHQSATEVADALRAVLGDRAAEIGALLAAQPH